MSENNRDQQLDALLDSLLSVYSAVEPRPGIEARIRSRLNAHVARRRRQWTWAFAVSAAGVLIAAWLVRTRMETVSPPTETVQPKLAVEKPAQMLETIPASALRPRAVPVRTRDAAPKKTRALLQLADDMHSSDGLVFERAQSYVAPAQPTQAAPEPQAAEQPAGGRINIQNLGVESIEIKELAPSRGDEKGNL